MARCSGARIVFALAFGTALGFGAQPAAAAGDANAPRTAPDWSYTWQTGVSQGMQLSLGALFNQGPAWQNRLTATRTNSFRRGDQISLYGWNTSDLRSANSDFETGIRYRAPIAKLARGVLTGGGGLEHWNFPSVLGGTKDVALDTYLGWSGGGEKVPITISGNGKTLLRSDLRKGTFACFMALHTQKLGRLGQTRFALQHGPAYIYSWGLYGRDGHRVLRYYGTAVVNHGRWAAEVMLRPQAGLQPRIPDNRYWSVALIRRFGR